MNSSISYSEGNWEMYFRPAPGTVAGIASRGIQKGYFQVDFSSNLGSLNPIYFGKSYRKTHPYDSSHRYNFGFRPGFLLNVDLAVHQYISIGVYVGMDQGINKYQVHGNIYKDRQIGVGFGARSVFHIYQIVAMNANTKLDPSRLDFYATLHVGGILYVNKNINDKLESDFGRNKKITGGFSTGIGLGVRYYFTQKVGIFGEVGWNEMSIGKLGFALKL
ncbi:MAG: hypothetical protein U0U67_11780 [Chitinophagales bacterium]